MRRYPVQTYCLILAMVLGLMTNGMLRDHPWGLNFFLFMVVFAAGIELVARQFAYHGKFGTASILFFASCFLWTDSAFLKAWDFIAILGLLSVPYLERMRIDRTMVSLYQAIRAGAEVVRGAVSGVVMLEPAALNLKSATGVRVWKNGVMAARGIAVGLPILMIFVGLLAEADKNFADMLDAVASHSPKPFLLSVWFIALGFWLTGGYLVHLAASNETLPEDIPVKLPQRSMVEIGAPLVVLTMILSAFMAFQIRYVFGGAEYIQATWGTSVAEFARRGFFELVAVSGLAIPVLGVAAGLVKWNTPHDARSFKVIANTLIVLMGGILLSALYRMSIYVDAFGLSVDRVYATTAMAWFGITFGLFSMTVLRQRPARFIHLSATSALALLALLNTANPDAIVTKQQFRRAESTGQVDFRYLASLSADAFPTILDGHNEAWLQPSDSVPTRSSTGPAEAVNESWSPALRQLLDGPNQQRVSEWCQRGWQSWNWSIRAAKKALVRAGYGCGT